MIVFMEVFFSGDQRRRRYKFSLKDSVVVAENERISYEILKNVFDKLSVPEQRSIIQAAERGPLVVEEVVLVIFDKHKLKEKSERLRLRSEAEDIVREVAQESIVGRKTEDSETKVLSVSE